jgi:hypothetical protein
MVRRTHPELAVEDEFYAIAGITLTGMGIAIAGEIALLILVIMAVINSVSPLVGYFQLVPTKYVLASTTYHPDQL